MAKARVTASALRVREGPGLDHEIIDVSPRGTVVEVYDPSGWAYVRLPDGTLGWMSKKHLVEIEDFSLVNEDLISADCIVETALSQRGKPYVFGAEADGDPDPDAFDCSELVQWVAAECEVLPAFPDGAIYQQKHCAKYGTIIPASRALRVRGALLFRISPTGNHVAISLGNNTTIEAKGRAYGVDVFSAEGRPWTHGGLIPGVYYG